MLTKKKIRKCERKVQEVQVRATVEKGGEAIFGLYLFLKRKVEIKLEECSKRLRYGYLSKFGMDSPICLLGTLLTPSLIVFGLVKP